MTVVCAGGQVNGGDREPVNVSLVAALCCCIASPVTRCLEGRFTQRVNLLLS
jgi:hypothetical protein